MSEIINLRRARKQRNRDNKAKDSTVKRAAFGESKASRNVVELSNARLNKTLDHHKRDEHLGEDE